MKASIRSLVFTFIALYLTQLVINGFDFVDDTNLTMFVIVFVLAFANLLMSPIFKILGLPHKGPGYIFMKFGLNLAILYVLVLFVPSFVAAPSTVSELLILGIVLPSKSLTKTWSLVFSSLLFVTILVFFEWLSNPKKR